MEMFDSLREFFKPRGKKKEKKEDETSDEPVMGFSSTEKIDKIDFEHLKDKNDRIICEKRSVIDIPGFFGFKG